MLINVGTRCTPPFGRGLDGVVGQSGAVFDAVDPGGQQPGQRVLAEDVRGHPGAGPVRDGDRLGQHVVRPERGQIADGPVDPVADDLDPRRRRRRAAWPPRRAGPPGRPGPPRGRGCTAWSRDVPAGPDQHRQVVAADQRRVSSGDPQSRSASAPVCRFAVRLLFGLVQGGGAVRASTRRGSARRRNRAAPTGQLDARIAGRDVDERAVDGPQVDRLAGSRVGPGDVQAAHRLLLRELQL